MLFLTIKYVDWIARGLELIILYAATFLCCTANLSLSSILVHFEFYWW